MKIFFKKWYRQWKELLSERKFRISLIAGFLILAVGYYLNYRASLYTEKISVFPVGDLILDHLPTVNLIYMYTFGIYLTMAIISLYPFFFRPDLAPFGLKTFAFFMMTRAFFITLTHLGAPENYLNLPQLADQPGLLKIFYTNDLFFSAHTGLPFLGALLFWKNIPLRIFLIAMSIGQAMTVLLMHVHYSIDVFSAYFITYTIYVVSDKIFNNLNLSFVKIIQRLEFKMRFRLPR